MGSKEPIGDKPTPTVSSHEGRRSRVGRLRLPYLLGHYPARLVWAAFLFVNGFLTIGLLASFAMTSGTPLIFPSLGPTAVLTVPESDAAGRMSPKHVMRPRCWDPLWLCFALADGLDSRFADNSGKAFLRSACCVRHFPWPRQAPSWSCWTSGIHRRAPPHSSSRWGSSLGPTTC